MERARRFSSRRAGILLLLGLWGVVNGVEWWWIRLDESIPGWDEANHLSTSLSYLQAFQEWRWQDIWRISNKFPPLTYMLAALTQGIWGGGNDQALLINWGLSAVLVAAVYGIGRRLFSSAAGLWGGAIVAILPGLSHYRLAFLTDTTLAASTVLGFACLTCWNLASDRRQQWLWSAAFGGSLGLALLSKQTSLFFLFCPLLVAGSCRLWRRRWEQALQLLAGLFLALLISGPWYRTNWVYAFSSYQRAIVRAGVNEGDPPIDTWGAWTYYLLDLPGAVSWIWILVPVLGLLAYRFGRGAAARQGPVLPLRSSILWAGLYLVGSYVLLSLLRNKDPRYIMPCLPVLAVLAGYGMSLWPGRWRAIPLGSYGLAMVLWWTSLFPIPNQGALLGVSPRPAEPVRAYPQAEVVDAIIRATPCLRANIGVIPSISGFNHNNVGYFGALRGFQVVSRELGSRPESVAQDGRSFDWLIASPGPLPGDHASDTQLAFGRRLAADPAFDRVQAWTLPGGGEVCLYHRRQPLVTVTVPGQSLSGLHLQVDLPPTAAIGEPIPVTYHWSGDWQALADGLVLLTWYKRGEAGPTDQFWIHDHQIGFGTLFAGVESGERPQRAQVTEATAMLAPATLATGRYALSAEYVNVRTGERRPLAVPAVEVELDRASSGRASQELDWPTQLRQLAPLMNEGIPGLRRVFDQVARLNRYDPVQGYVKQTQRSLDLRLQQSSASGPIAPTAAQRAHWYLTKSLAHGLDEDSPGAISALQSLIHLTPDNPYPYAYLALVHLYDWHPGLAHQALQPARTLAPDLPEVQLLDAVIRLLRGDVFQAVDLLEAIRAQGIL